MFIGSFVCPVHSGAVLLPDMCGAQDARYTCSCGTLKNKTPYMHFQPLSKNAAHRAPGARRGRRGQTAVIQKGRLLLPRKTGAHLAQSEALTLLGLGREFILHRPVGLVSWDTYPGGQVTLVAVGREACAITREFPEKSLPVDCSSFAFIRPGTMVHRLLCDPSFGAPPENRLASALRHTGLLLLFTCPETGGDPTAGRLLRLAAEQRIPAIVIAAEPPHAADAAARQKAQNALMRLCPAAHEGCLVVLPRQEIQNGTLRLPTTDCDFRALRYETSVQRALLSALVYAVGAILLPFQQEARLHPRLLSAGAALLGGGMMRFSIKAYATTGEGLQSIAWEPQNAHDRAFAASFGGQPLRDTDLQSLLPHSETELPFSFCYGDWSPLGENILTITFTPVCAAPTGQSTPPTP